MKSYLITDPAYYHDLPSLRHYLKTAFGKHHPDVASFRDKVHSDIRPYAEAFLELGREEGTGLLLINRSVALARSLGFDGVHLTSTQFDEIAVAKSYGLRVFISTHSLDEAKMAQRLGADAITVSPIFDSPGKGLPKGLDFLENILHEVNDISVFALGGIVSKDHIALLKASHVDGFASIRYFV